jgi:hypothetical protein
MIVCYNTNTLTVIYVIRCTHRRRVLGTGDFSNLLRPATSDTVISFLNENNGTKTALRKNR